MEFDDLSKLLSEEVEFKNEQERETEKLWAEIDSLIEQDFQFEVVEPSQYTSELMLDPAYAEMQETFLAIARNTLNPVSRYMNALSEIGYSYEILEITDIIVTSLIPQVEAVGLQEHVDDLTFFKSLVLLALGETDQHAKLKIAEVVTEGFKFIEKKFGLKYRSYRLAVDHLVSFYKGMKQHHLIGDADIKKFFAIGVPSLTWVRRTKVEEMVSLSGISMDVMKEIRKLALLYHASKGGDASLIPILKVRNIDLGNSVDDEVTLPPIEQYNRRLPGNA